MSLIKQIVVILLLVGLATGGYQGWQTYQANATVDTQSEAPAKRSRPPPAVVTAPAQIRDLETLAEAVGSTRAQRAVEITPLAAGRITELNFRAGQRVAKGDVLLRLDNEIQRADLVEAQARVTEARLALERARSLRRTSAVSDESVDRLIATLAIAEANVERSQRRLLDRTIIAPFDGVVGFTQVEVGARVKEGDMITTLDELALIELEFSLPERLFGTVRRGQRVIAAASAFPERRFEGEIDAIDSRIDAVGRAFKTRAVIANPHFTLPAGMFMHLSVVLDARRALTVPEESLVVEGGDTYLFVIVDGDKGPRAERRDVTLGERGFGHVEIVKGVAEGDKVVTHGLQRVRDGAPVALGKPGGAKSGGAKAGGAKKADAKREKNKA